MFDLIAKVLRGLNSDDNPWSMATAIALGMIVGLSPVMAPHNLLIVLLAFLFRTHLASFWLSVILFAMLALPVTGILNQIGNQLLGNADLQGLWTSMYQNEFWRFTRFNNSLVLGSLVAGILLWIPVAIFARWFVGFYRRNLKAKVDKIGWVQWLKATKIISAVMKLREPV